MRIKNYFIYNFLYINYFITTLTYTLRLLIIYNNNNILYYYHHNNNFCYVFFML